ncbi:hypothetical protein MHIP_59710 [Mycolicibacterium hippocampi]|uniref:Uncharacterized protein n=1 Tax=Mycolicibacterium hippocampi TaxID=659824 RepID=A0A7I9ZXZ4_9MYCO|nr:hypothetical protein MHIP_59710 [Mycolicibacterium hippocampi]
MYGATSVLLGALPLAALAAGIAVLGWGVRGTESVSAAVLPALVWIVPATLAALLTYAALTVLGVRLLAVGLHEGYHPVRSRSGWQLWATERLMDAARNHLFPIYASLLTPWWLRLLGAEVGRGTEISTALLIPKFTVIEDGASPTTPWSRPTNWAAVGSTSPGPPSASAPSWGTQASPSPVAGSPTTGWSRCSRQHRTKQGGLVLAGQPAGAAAAPAHGRRRAADLSSVRAAEGCAPPSRRSGSSPSWSRSPSGWPFCCPSKPWC